MARMRHKYKTSWSLLCSLVMDLIRDGGNNL